MRAKAFTLIELLIVVAIIAILAAIALPNFLEAQTRSKVARVQSEQRTLAIALEAYCCEHNHYPPSSLEWQHNLTTPVTYMTSCCDDIFCKLGVPGSCRYQYAVCKKMGSWILVSRGPDRIDDWAETMWMCPMRSTYPPTYDPTNGTISYGDIWRLTKQ